MSKHTPGQWHTSAMYSAVGIYSESGELLAKTAVITDITAARRGADAKLIAAAPDLLSACEAALGAFVNANAIDWSELERAISKATA